MKTQHRILWVLAIITASLLACSQLTQLAPSTATPQPTLTPTEPPPTTGSLQGRLVEAVLKSDDPQPRPPLSNTLVMLCAGYHDQVCTANAGLTTYTDESGAFSFPTLEPGTYAILYNPFLISDGQAYLSHYDGRQIEFSDVSRFVDSVNDGETHFSISGAGVEVVIGNDGKLSFGAPNADSAIFTSDFTLVAEYAGKGIPVTFDIRLGEATQITLKTHAVSKMGEISLEPAGERIALPGIEFQPASAKPTSQVAATQDLPTAAVLTEAAPTQSDAAQAVPPASSGTAFIYEYFDDNQNNWNLVDEKVSWGTVKAGITNGVLRASGSLNESMYYNFFPEIDFHADAMVSVDVKNVSASSPKTEYGLVLYAQDDYKHVTFTITDQGTYTIMGYFGEYEFYALDVSSDAIQRGEFNMLQVLMKGNHFTFYINGVEVQTAQIKDLPASGKSGIFIDWMNVPGEDQVIEFDNFNVVAP